MTKFTPLIALSLVTIGIGLSGCSPTINQRGNLVQDYQLSEVMVGTSTRSDVLRAMGSPTTKAPFNDDIWYYIGQKTAKKGILDPKVVEERVVAVMFSPDGTVAQAGDIERERIDIPVSRDKTPTHGNEVSVMQQLLGNLGKFNPGASSATTTAGGSRL